MFRNRGKAEEIGFLSIIIGYGAALVGVPVLASLILMLMQAMFGTSIISGAGLGRAGEVVMGWITAAQSSWALSWTGVPVSAPMVWLARRRNWCGWGTAMVAGALTAMLVFGAMGTNPLQVLPALGPPSAMIGLVFWMMIRVLHPKVFLPARS